MLTALQHITNVAVGESKKVGDDKVCIALWVYALPPPLSSSNTLDHLRHRANHRRQGISGRGCAQGGVSDAPCASPPPPPSRVIPRCGSGMSSS
jgi:hypothetical protein